MFDIKLEKLLDKPIDQVFELLADHGNYQNFRGVKGSKLLEQGSEEPNGLGALRYIDLGSVNLDERITHFERPTRLDYLIERSSPLPFKHEVGSIKLTAQGDKTLVNWVSKGTISIPVLGKLFFDPMFEKQGSKGFASLLRQIEAA